MPYPEIVLRGEIHQHIRSFGRHVMFTLAVSFEAIAARQVTVEIHYGRNAAFIAKSVGFSHCVKHFLPFDSGI